LKLPGGYRCKCCYDPQRGKARERRAEIKEIQTQLSEPTYEDFRELPDDIWYDPLREDS
jgi:hypothetical protein